jgi:hypothetical protein
MVLPGGGYGGIGRHNRLKICAVLEYGFESRCPQSRRRPRTTSHGRILLLVEDTSIRPLRGDDSSVVERRFVDPKVVGSIPVHPVQHQMTIVFSPDSGTDVTLVE